LTSSKTQRLIPSIGSFGGPLIDFRSERRRRRRNNEKHTFLCTSSFSSL